MKHTLGGNVCIRNGEELDFCWELAVKSLLPVCAQVVICDSDSTDGTSQKIGEWAAREPKIKAVNYPWKDPRGDGMWVMDWTNWAREQLDTDYHFQLDADEILHDNAYAQIEMLLETTKPISILCWRYNFWRDAQHLIPPDKCCGHRVIRMAPTDLWLPADYPHEKGRAAMDIEIDCPLQIFHYGFLRRREAFFKKERGLQRAFVNRYDPKLELAEKYPGNWMAMPCISSPTDNPADGWENDVRVFDGKHPVIAHDWLRARGYSV